MVELTKEVFFKRELGQITSDSHHKIAWILVFACKIIQTHRPLLIAIEYSHQITLVFVHRLFDSLFSSNGILIRSHHIMIVAYETCIKYKP